jgi:hypothetical protein
MTSSTTKQKTRYGARAVFFLFTNLLVWAFRQFMSFEHRMLLLLLGLWWWWWIDHYCDSPYIIIISGIIIVVISTGRTVSLPLVHVAVNTFPSFFFYNNHNNLNADDEKTLLPKIILRADKGTRKSRLSEYSILLFFPSETSSFMMRQAINSQRLATSPNLTLSICS